jgi:uncharacterized protein (TIGR01777 family)
MPRALVTGVTGLVGANVAASLHARGWEIVATSRDPDAARRSVPILAKAFPHGAPEALEGVDAVVNLAGERVAGRWTEARRRAIEDSRVGATKKLVDAFATSRPGVLVSASAMGIYGIPSDPDRELREDDPAGDDFLARVCAGWEREAMRAETLGVRVVCLRISLVLAKRGGALREMLPAARAGLGGPLGSGEQWWSWIHEDDLAALVVHAIDRDLRGPIHAASPHPVRQIEFARTLGKVLHRPAFVPTPAFAMRVALGGFAGEVLASRKLSAAKALACGFSFRFPELEPALRHLLGERTA